MARTRRKAKHKRRNRRSARGGVRVGAQGRLVIPSELRMRLGIHAGDELTASVEHGSLVLTPRTKALERLKELFRDVKGSLADELSLERAREARREWEGLGP